MNKSYRVKIDCGNCSPQENIGIRISNVLNQNEVSVQLEVEIEDICYYGFSNDFVSLDDMILYCRDRLKNLFPGIFVD